MSFLFTVIIIVLLILLLITREIADGSTIRPFIPLIKSTIKYKIEIDRKIISVNINNEVIKFRDEIRICRSIPLFFFYKDYLKVNYNYSKTTIYDLHWRRSKIDSTVFDDEKEAQDLLDDIKNNPNKYQFYV